jgi:hypothetical protein
MVAKRFTLPREAQLAAESSQPECVDASGARREIDQVLQRRKIKTAKFSTANSQRLHKRFKPQGPIRKQHSLTGMMVPQTAIYSSPKEGLPYLIVTFTSDGLKF